MSLTEKTETCEARNSLVIGARQRRGTTVAMPRDDHPTAIDSRVPTRPRDVRATPILRRRRRYRFRWGFLGILAAILVVAWFLENLPGPTFDWQNILDWFGLSRRGEERLTLTVLLGLALIAVVYVYKELKQR